MIHMQGLGKNVYNYKPRGTCRVGRKCSGTISTLYNLPLLYEYCLNHSNILQKSTPQKI